MSDQGIFIGKIVVDKVIEAVANAIAKMHSGDSIHGDLTTSNMMIKPKLPIEVLLSGNAIKMTAQ